MIQCLCVISLFCSKTFVKKKQIVYIRHTPVKKSSHSVATRSAWNPHIYTINAPFLIQLTIILLDKPGESCVTAPTILPNKVCGSQDYVYLHANRPGFWAVNCPATPCGKFLTQHGKMECEGRTNPNGNTSQNISLVLIEKRKELSDEENQSKQIICQKVITR